MNSNLVQCEDCGWKGELDECAWRYDFIERVQRVTPYCPKCGSDLLWHIAKKGCLYDLPKTQ